MSRNVEMARRIEAAPVRSGRVILAFDPVDGRARITFGDEPAA
jgi:hypothetical protein